ARRGVVRGLHRARRRIDRKTGRRGARDAHAFAERAGTEDALRARETGIAGAARRTAREREQIRAFARRDVGTEVRQEAVRQLVHAVRAVRLDVPRADQTPGGGRGVATDADHARGHDRIGVADVVRLRVAVGGLVVRRAVAIFVHAVAGMVVGSGV